MMDLNGLLDGTGAGWTLESAQGINDSGQIVGSGLFGGRTQAFLLTPSVAPAPEPSPLAALTLGATITGALILRRRRAAPSA